VSRTAGKSPANGAAATAEQAEKAARRIQAKAEGARTGDVITWKGEKFRLAGGELPGAAQLIMAHMANQDVTVRDPDAEDGMWQILEMCLAPPSGPQPGQPDFDVEAYDPGDFKRFMRHAAKTRATIEEIVEALQAAVEVVAARPTMPRGGSSDGPAPTTANSTANSSAAPATASNG
jgi:hypothetical protein